MVIGLRIISTNYGEAPWGHIIIHDTKHIQLYRIIRIKTFNTPHDDDICDHRTAEFLSRCSMTIGSLSLSLPNSKAKSEQGYKAVIPIENQILD